MPSENLANKNEIFSCPTFPAQPFLGRHEIQKAVEQQPLDYWSHKTPHRVSMFYGAGAVMSSCFFYGSQLLCKIAKGFIFSVNVLKTIACLSELQAKTCSSATRLMGWRVIGYLTVLLGKVFPIGAKSWVDFFDGGFPPSFYHRVKLLPSHRRENYPKNG